MFGFFFLNKYFVLFALHQFQLFPKRWAIKDDFKKALQERAEATKSKSLWGRNQSPLREGQLHSTERFHLISRFNWLKFC